ncbi:MAG: hypothetical protein R3280_11025 [Marinobacter sp.]|uniref:hypothetical protein n=1 Tax=Marinobacter sp. TaxID=50741 RepID=UPI00299DABF9|nr:hypothetical protein [Marinobacter sp.]MDX1635163.1 hypothetical protein [Marinobacter sp.]
MALHSAAVVIGNHAHLPREIWSSFVQSGLVENVVIFSSVHHLVDSFAVNMPSRELDVKLLFFLIDGPDDLTIPLDLKAHAQLARVPLIGFYGEKTGLTDTDIQTLYDRRVSSVIRLPLRFQDVGNLVLQLDRYWAMGKLPECILPLPLENIYQPH